MQRHFFSEQNICNRNVLNGSFRHTRVVNSLGYSGKGTILTSLYPQLYSLEQNGADLFVNTLMCSHLAEFTACIIAA